MVSQNNDHIVLNWNRVPGAMSYRVSYRYVIRGRTSRSLSHEVVAAEGILVEQYRLSSLWRNMTYKVTLSVAVPGATEYVHHKVLSCSTTASLRATDRSASSVTVAWNPVENFAGGYEITCQEENTNIEHTVPSAGFASTVSGLTPSTFYTLRLYAVAVAPNAGRQILDTSLQMTPPVLYFTPNAAPGQVMRNISMYTGLHPGIALADRQGRNDVCFPTPTVYRSLPGTGGTCGMLAPNLVGACCTGVDISALTDPGATAQARQACLGSSGVRFLQALCLVADRSRTVQGRIGLTGEFRDALRWARHFVPRLIGGSIVIENNDAWYEMLMKYVYACGVNQQGLTVDRGARSLVNGQTFLVARGDNEVLRLMSHGGVNGSVQCTFGVGDNGRSVPFASKSREIEYVTPIASTCNVSGLSTILKRESCGFDGTCNIRATSVPCAMRSVVVRDDFLSNTSELFFSKVVQSMVVNVQTPTLSIVLRIHDVNNGWPVNAGRLHLLENPGLHRMLDVCRESVTRAGGVVVSAFESMGPGNGRVNYNFGNSGASLFLTCMPSFIAMRKVVQ